MKKTKPTVLYQNCTFPTGLLGQINENSSGGFVLVGQDAATNPSVAIQLDGEGSLTAMADLLLVIAETLKERAALEKEERRNTMRKSIGIEEMIGRLDNMSIVQLLQGFSPPEEDDT